MANVRRRALRKGVWFSTLTDQERILTGLVSKHVNIVKNTTLAMVIARLIVKLVPAIRNAFYDRIERLGKPIAEAAVMGAHAMGWKDSSKWVDDLSIVRWYGLTAYLLSGVRMR